MNNIVVIILEVLSKVVANFGYDHLFLIAASMDETGVLLKEHDGVIKQLFIGSFINEVVAASEDGIELNAVSEVL